MATQLFGPDCVESEPRYDKPGVIVISASSGRLQVVPSLEPGTNLITTNYRHLSLETDRWGKCEKGKECFFLRKLTPP